MSSLQSFLGFPADPPFEQTLQTSNRYLVELFTSGGPYLQKIFFQNTCYFGKFTPPASPLEDLESLQSNILSILRKLAPHYSFKEDSLILLPLPKT